MITVTLYMRENEEKCIEVEKEIQTLLHDLTFQFVKINIDTDPALKAKYGEAIPVVKVGPYTLDGEISRQRLQISIGAASDRKNHLDQIGDKSYEEKAERGSKYSSIDKFTHWLSRHYMALFNGILFIYVGVAFLPAVFLKVNQEIPAKIIYTIYSPLCHQLAFRSWFLFGQQVFYPREIAGVPGVASYENVVLNNRVVNETSADFILTARDFTGSPEIGYKVALCERDVALYGGMLLFGIIYALSSRSIKQIPWYIWLVFGLVPIGVDGVSQFPSLMSTLQSWLPIRESTPFLRSLTGFLFGSLTAWYLYPIIEESMKETRAFLASKKAILSQTTT